jgi:hypothetical protein
MPAQKGNIGAIANRMNQGTTEQDRSEGPRAGPTTPKQTRHLILVSLLKRVGPASVPQSLALPPTSFEEDSYALFIAYLLRSDLSSSPDEDKYRTARINAPKLV